MPRKPYDDPKVISRRLREGIPSALALASSGLAGATARLSRVEEINLLSAVELKQCADLRDALKPALAALVKASAIADALAWPDEVKSEDVFG